MDLDPTVIIPAVLFTVVAVYLASSLLSRKPDRPSSSSAGTNKPKVGYGDEVPPSRVLAEPLFSLGPEPAEKNRDVPDLKVKAVSEPAPEPVTVPEEVTKQAAAQEPFPEQIQMQESSPEPLEAAVPVADAAKEPKLVPEPVKEPEAVKETVKIQKTFPEPLVAQKPFPETVTAVETVPEQDPELVIVTETLEEPPIVPEPVKEPEAVPEPPATPEPVTAAASECNPVPEHVGVADPETVVPEPALEVVQQPGTKPQQVEKVGESAPEPAPEMLSKSTDHVEEVSREPEPEQEISLNDVAAAADELMITAQNEPSKLETLTKKEVQEEQRVQQEQLEAIFLLLQQNRELLGSETLKDSEEQLKLRSASETPAEMVSIHLPNI